jgi:PilZ domain
LQISDCRLGGDHRSVLPRPVSAAEIALAISNLQSSICNPQGSVPISSERSYDRENGMNQAITERRTVQRFPCNIVGFGRVLGTTSETRWGARLSELSVNGARVRLDFPLSEGTSLTLQFRSDDRRFWCTVRAKIVHIEPAAANEWIAGCAFDHPLSREARRAFLQTW